MNYLRGGVDTTSEQIRTVLIGCVEKKISICDQAVVTGGAGIQFKCISEPFLTVVSKQCQCAYEQFLKVTSVRVHFIFEPFLEVGASTISERVRVFRATAVTELDHSAKCADSRLHPNKHTPLYPTKSEWADYAVHS